MVPPFQYNADVMDIDFGFDPEDTSLLRPSDVTYELGKPSPYQDPGMMLSTDLAKAEDLADQNAMRLLMESINKQAEVSPEQMLATALLNIIPTAGGYLIGKSVGEPDLPPGYFEAGGTRAALGKGVYGAEAGALMGLEGGSNAAQGYLKALEGDQEQKNKAFGAMAAIETRRAERLGQQSNQYQRDAVNAQRELDTLPIREASQMRLQDNSAKNTMERQLELDKLRDERERMDPAVLAATQKALGIPYDPDMMPSELRAATAAVEAGRRQVGQDTRLAGENLIPPSPATKAAMKSILDTKAIGERYINQFQEIANKDPSWLRRNVESALPATELGALQQSLNLFAVQVRNARENGVMTEQDFQRYSSYLQLKPLDTMESVLGRMKELQEVTNISARSTLTNARLGRENVSDYEKFFGLGPPLRGGPVDLNQGGGAPTRIPISERIKQIQGIN